MTTTYLVACVGQKQSSRQPAGLLYTSTWFKKARSFVLAQRSPWFILSAKHGLLAPDRPTAPYETTLNTMGKVERRAWAHRVLEELIDQVPRGTRIVFLAGEHYREHLIPILTKLGYTVEVPMQGLAIGQQLAWLSNENAPSAQPQGRDRFYELLGELKDRTGGHQRLSEGRGRVPKDALGVYFFFEETKPGGDSTTAPDGTPRVVRVGTLGVARGTKSTLWKRLAQHRGAIGHGGGNHRGSVFRLLVGKALIQRDGLDFPM